MKTIRTYSNLSEAGFASSLLEAAGIKVLLADEQSFTIGYGLAALGLRLQVDDADVELAERVLDRGPDAAGDKPLESETSPTEQGSIPLGVFAAGAVALGVLAFAIHQVIENRRTENSGAGTQTHEYDYNHDGRSDCFYFYRHNELVRTEHDRNFDGKIDDWEFFDDNGIRRGERDCNFDGRVDAWFMYSHGEVVSSKWDTDFNGLADLLVAYEHGVTSRADVIPNESGNVSRRAIYKAGVLTEESVDENRDGVFDYKILHDPFGETSKPILIAPGQ